MGFDKKKNRRPKNRKTKTVLVFDEKSRSEYLTGFRKRKDKRRLEAKEQNEKMIKEEKQALKLKRKEFMEKKVREQVLPPDLEELAEKYVTELPEHTVTITDISDVDLAGQGGLRLGVKTFDDDKPGRVEVVDNEEQDDNDDTEHTQTNTAGPMTMKNKKKILKKIDQRIQMKEKKFKLKKSSSGHRKSRKLLSKKKQHKQKKPQ